MLWACRYFTLDKTNLGIIDPHCCQRVKNDRTYGLTALASRSDQWPRGAARRWLRRSKELAAYSELESDAVFVRSSNHLLSLTYRKQNTVRRQKDDEPT